MALFAWRPSATPVKSTFELGCTPMNLDLDTKQNKKWNGRRACDFHCQWTRGNIDFRGRIPEWPQWRHTSEDWRNSVSGRVATLADARTPSHASKGHFYVGHAIRFLHSTRRFWFLQTVRLTDPNLLTFTWRAITLIFSLQTTNYGRKRPTTERETVKKRVPSWKRAKPSPDLTLCGLS